MPTGIYPKIPQKIPAPDASAAIVPEGYKVEIFMKDLIWPTSIEFDESGNVYVAEAGYVYGDLVAPTPIFKISLDGTIVRFAEGFIGPVTDLLWHNDLLYVSHKGKISTVSQAGNITDIITDLPSYGDHQNNGMSIGPDGKLYFGQGTVTNSGIVGLDNVYPYVWLMLYPEEHDIPAKDIKLTNESFLTPQANNVLARQGNLLSFGSNLTYAVTSLFNRNKNTSLLVRTRGFNAFGEKSKTIKGQVKSSGTILRANLDGSGLEVYAWGLRNPFGVVWGADGQLYVTDNGYDARGSRPIANAKDNIFQIKQDAWYGFPDFSSGIPVTDPQFRSQRGSKIEFLMKAHPELDMPWMTRPANSATAKFDFSTNDSFGFQGHIFLAEFGSGTPATGEANFSGYSVVRIDPATKQAQAFLSTRATEQELESGAVAGPRRPVEAKFSRNGEALYIVDIGVIGFDLAGAGPFPSPAPGTGVIWRITKTGNNAAAPPGNLSPMPPKANSN
ncbi:PQQ-dependent sugar dehydrogenase [Gelidibacter gilvus]|uniref:PQQ-dependent sugar dehydrogenase n=1 Tax=Gelidibacter gilvus TaxID=59602 RepID=UPI001CB90C8F|nr:PQQ-dependent sugar dehydrogenase [Gelidibacter gilvus]